MKQTVVTLSFRCIMGLAVLALSSGIWCLETHPASSGIGYLLAFSGATLIVLMPAKMRCEHVSRVEWLFGLGAALLTIGALAIWIAIFVLTHPPQEISDTPVLPLWLGMIVLLAVAAYCHDRGKGLRLPTPSHGEYAVCAGIFLLSLFIRSWGTSTLVGDEALHTMKALNLTGNNIPPLLGALGEDGYPNVLLHIHAIFHKFTRSFCSILEIQKWLSYTSGALSIVLWYGVVRIYSGRIVAQCASILLIFFGWHWLNSRFVYAYPPDLAIIALGVLSLSLAFRFQSTFMATIAGISLGAAFLLQRSALMLVPFFCYLGAEAFISTSKGNRKSVLVAVAVLLVSFSIAYEPALLQHLQGNYSMPLQDRAIKMRAEVLPTLGFTPISALVFMFYDAFKQFQVSMNDFYRHVFRPGAPILDPMFSALFTIGIVWCLVNLKRSSAARICLVGLLIFILPMALGFPVYDHQRGLARRMLGTSLFLAWMGGLGAIKLASLCFTEKKLANGAMLACTISAFFNIWHYLTIYSQLSPDGWYSPAGRGIQSAAMVDLALRAERSEIPAIVLEGYHATLLGLPDSSTRKAVGFVKVKSVEEIRSTLLAKRGTLQLVIIPWDSKSVPRESQDFAQELSDIIPPYLWIVGPSDQDGIPMVRYAFVRPK